MHECPIPLYLNPQLGCEHPNRVQEQCSNKMGFCWRSFCKGAAVLGTLTELGAQRGTTGPVPMAPSGLTRAQDLGGCASTAPAHYLSLAVPSEQRDPAQKRDFCFYSSTCHLLEGSRVGDSKASFTPAMPE